MKNLEQTTLSEKQIEKIENFDRNTVFLVPENESVRDFPYRRYLCFLISLIWSFQEKLMKVLCHFSNVVEEVCKQKLSSDLQVLKSCQEFYSSLFETLKKEEQRLLSEVFSRNFSLPCSDGYKDVLDCPKCCDVFQVKVGEELKNFSLFCDHSSYEKTKSNYWRRLNYSDVFFLLSVSTDCRENNFLVKVYSIDVSGFPVDDTQNFSERFSGKIDGITSKTSFEQGRVSHYLVCRDTKSYYNLVSAIEKDFPTFDVLHSRISPSLVNLMGLDL